MSYLKATMHQIQFLLLDPLAGFMGLTSKGSGKGSVEGKGEEGDGWREGEGGTCEKCEA